MWATWSLQPNLITHKEVRRTAAGPPPPLLLRPCLQLSWMTNLNPQDVVHPSNLISLEQRQPIATATAASICSIDRIGKQWDVDFCPTDSFSDFPLIPPDSHSDFSSDWSSDCSSAAVFFIMSQVFSVSELRRFDTHFPRITCRRCSICPSSELEVGSVAGASVALLTSSPTPSAPLLLQPRFELLHSELLP